MQPKRVVNGDAAPSARGKKRSGAVVSIDRSAGMVWRGPEYPVLSPGRYTVRGALFQGPEWVRSFRRWSLRVEFALVHESVSVSAFFNLGNDRDGPRIGRQSRFYKAWVIANGEHPRKGEVMTPDVFLEGQFFEVTVADSQKDVDRHDKSKAEVYSIVTHIHSMTHS